MGDFLMPSLGADMETGTLVEWEKQPGDPVHRGDIVAVVETQKGAIEIEAYEDGVLASVLVGPGQAVPVGTKLARIDADIGDAKPGPGLEIDGGPEPADGPVSPDTSLLDETASLTGNAPPDRAGESTTGPGESSIAPMPAAAPATGNLSADQLLTTTPRLRISPAAKRLAEQHRFDASGLHGSGPTGEITLHDITQALEPVDEKPRADQSSGMRAAIGAAMLRSKQSIPHYYLQHDVDISTAMAWVERVNQEREPSERLLLGALYVRAVALAIMKFGEFSGHHVDGCFTPATRSHVGMAINLRGGGLVAPAIHDADRKDLDAIMSALRSLVARVRQGRFKASELNDPTITLSSLGERGVDTLFGVIYPPQVAIVGMGAPRLRPWVKDGQLVPRPVLTLTLAADHRVSDGHRGALFLAAVAERLHDPEKLQ